MVIIVMILLFGMISFVTNLASPMGDILKNQFQVANWMGTLGVLANFIAYAVMGIPAGNLLQKQGYKKTALLAVTVGFAGVGIQTIAGLLTGNVAFGIYLLGAFIAGFSMCMLNIVVNPMLNKLGGGGNRGNQLVQLGGSFNSLMGTAVIFLTGVFVPSIAKAHISQVFPLMFIALAIFALAFIVIFFTKIPENAPQAAKVEEKSQYSPMSFRHFVLGAIGIFIYVGVEVGIPNVLQKWLQNGGLSVAEGAEAIAGTVTATYWLLMLVGRLLGAALGAKVSAKNMLVAVSAVGLCLGTARQAPLLSPGNRSIPAPAQIRPPAVGDSSRRTEAHTPVRPPPVGSDCPPRGSQGQEPSLLGGVQTPRPRSRGDLHQQKDCKSSPFFAVWR